MNCVVVATYYGARYDLGAKHVKFVQEAMAGE